MKLFTSSQNAEFQARIAELESDNATLTANLATANEHVAELAGANERISELEASEAALTSQLEIAGTSISNLNAEIVTLKAAVATAENSAAQSAVEIAAATGIEAPLNIEGGGVTGASATMSRKDFTALKPSAAMKFTLNGGKLTD